MIEIDIPDFGLLQLTHLVMDYNGTLAVDGVLVDGVAERIQTLSSQIEIVVVTADTFGRAAAQLEGLPCSLSILPKGDHAKAKKAVVERFGAPNTVAVGNGRNDRLMLATAGLGIGIMLEEGIAVQTLSAADIICASITSALDLLRHPLRLTATLRS